MKRLKRPQPEHDLTGMDPRFLAKSSPFAMLIIYVRLTPTDVI